MSVFFIAFSHCRTLVPEGAREFRKADAFILLWLLLSSSFHYRRQVQDKSAEACRGVQCYADGSRFANLPDKRSMQFAYRARAEIAGQDKA